MAGSITPLPIMLLEEEEDRKRYAALQPPKSIVVRYGHLKFIAELPYDGKDKPGCGSKLVVTTSRGTELGEMLTTTCGNNGCGKSVSRKQMLQYIENSGGRDFPFTTQGKVVRVATVEDMQQQQHMESRKMPMIRFTKALITELGLPMKLVEIEMLLGGERIIFHYTSESWVDFRELVKRLAAEYQTRIEMHQVNARDEARLVADYEKCGQHCCCKQFLKVLKPVSMRSAKVQKATLDPTKISGRCGRLMCCLRYEDQTYEDLRKRLPHRQTRVMTADGAGTVIDTQILTQLVLVVLDDGQPPAAYPLENLEILKKDHPAYRKPEQPQPGYDGRDRRSSRRGPGGPGGPEKPSPRSQSQERSQDRSQGDRPSDGDASSSDETAEALREPARPRPGRPLGDDQVQSREGTDSSQLSADEGSRTTDDASAADASDGGASGDHGGTGLAGEEGHGGEARPRRGGRGRRRGRGDRGRSSSSQGEDNTSGQQNQSEGSGGTPGDAGDGGDAGQKRRRRRRRGGRGRGRGGAGEGGSSSGPRDSGGPADS